MKFSDTPERVRQVESRYDSRAKKIFSQPANFCQFCGQPMGENPNPTVARWEKRWSIHHDCANAVDGQLNRSVGMSLERPQG